MKDPVALPTQNQQRSKAPPVVGWAQVMDIARRHRRLIAVSVLVSCAGAWAVGFLHVPNYRATNTIVIKKPEDSQLGGVLSSISGGAGMWNNTDPMERINRYLSYMNSNDFFVEVASIVKFKEEYRQLRFTHPAEMSVRSPKFWQYKLGGQGGADLKEILAGEANAVRLEEIAAFIQSVTSAQVMGTDSISLTVSTLDPFTSVFLVNAVSEMFVAKVSDRDANELTDVKKFINEQIDKTVEALRTTELELVEFKKKHNIYSSKTEDNQFTTRARAIDQDMAMAQVKVSENKRLVQYYEKILKDGAIDISPQMTARIEVLRSKRALLQATPGADPNAVAQVDSQIAELAKNMAGPVAASHEGSIGEVRTEGGRDSLRKRLEGLRSESRILEARLETLGKSREELLKGLGELSKGEHFVMAKTRDLDLNYELYASLKKKLQEIEIQQIAAQSRATLAQRSNFAAPTLRPSLVLRMFFAILVGLFLGGGVAFALETTDGSVKERLDLESLGLTEGLRVPDLSKITAGLSPLGNHGKLVCLHQPESEAAMAFKSLRTRLAMQSGAQVITCLSAERGDGKSVVLANLAISFAQQGARTLLIEGDLRNSKFPELFRYRPGHGGLSDLLSLRTTLQSSVIRDWIPGLDLLPAGVRAEFPSELLAGEKMHILFERLRLMYDVILIDAPALKGSVDGVVLAYQSDCLLFVVSEHKTKAASVRHAVRELEQIGRRPMLTVLNHAEGGAPGSGTLVHARVQRIGAASVPRRPADDVRKFEAALREESDSWNKQDGKPQAS